MINAHSALPNPDPTSPASLSIVILTWNEATRIGDCLASLARQTRRDFEVVVVDAASTDATASIVAAAAPAFPVPLRLHVAATRLRVGPARNLGVALAHAELIAFLSADATADPDWVAQALDAAPSCDLLFGRQVHAPARPSVGAAVRGLRYHFPDSQTGDPKRYASNVNAVIRRRVLDAHPFGSSIGASAVDDLLLTERSAKAGDRIRYNPDMVVRHRDVDSARAELVKNLREGLGWGEYVGELGVHKSMLGWGLLLTIAIAASFIVPGVATLTALAAVLWAPALRRAWRRRKEMPRLDRLVGVLASPLFDVAFLLAYVRGLATRAPAAPSPKVPREIPA